MANKAPHAGNHAVCFDLQWNTASAVSLRSAGVGGKLHL